MSHLQRIGEFRKGERMILATEIDALKEQDEVKIVLLVK
jgi:hypothetical protein